MLALSLLWRAQVAMWSKEGLHTGQSGSFKPFLEASADDLQSVTQTNLRGALLCTRAAIRAMAASPLRDERRGHIFNMDGAGADGLPTANYAAYGATKAGIAHIMASLTAECNAANLNIGVHTLSPGMVLTGLLLDGATEQNKKVRNVSSSELRNSIAADCVRNFRPCIAYLEGRWLASMTVSGCRCLTCCASTLRQRQLTWCHACAASWRGKALWRTFAS
jgi:NAD(P)-dependent dehydrogenase (short-subunit alcohol dehydrogenase family)